MTMPHHALDIALTRPLTPAELRQATRTMPLAANHDATHLLAVTHAKTPGKALNRLRQQLGGQLPIDVITTHYPDANRQILLNVAFPPAVYTTLKSAARCAGQSPERFMQRALYRALAERADQEADRLDHALRQLLAHTTPAHLLSAVGHALTRRSESHT
ncbi:hypothetical protein ACFYR1_50480 [Streptomyces canus]|uniref:hypothetical protein n=1 Tax=Streptomyces canus TaxID=58343 RepID=UPI0036BB7A4C